MTQKEAAEQLQGSVLRAPQERPGFAAAAPDFPAAIQNSRIDASLPRLAPAAADWTGAARRSDYALAGNPTTGAAEMHGAESSRPAESSHPADLVSFWPGTHSDPAWCPISDPPASARSARPATCAAVASRIDGGSRIDQAAWLRAILTAPVYDVARRTPLDEAPGLSARLGARVLLKREDLQPGFSFKLRGAYNRLMQLSDAERARGVVAVSAGNHAQGVALGARRLGIDALIVMPATTPRIKVDAVAAFGARTVLYGDSYDEAAAHGRQLAEAQDRALIHPYDDAAVIAGQGTVAMEMLAQHRALDAVFVPVGGGGLCAGMAVYLKALDPRIRVVAVEPADAACLAAALRAAAPVRLDQIGLFVDGCAVRQIGAVPFTLLREFVDEVIVVDADQVCAAIRDVFEETRSIVEPAGALAVAGMKLWASSNSVTGATLAAVLSGANMNFDRLAHVGERAAIGEQHEALFGVEIPERPGSFLSFCRSIGRRAVTEFNYRWHGPQAAQVYVGVQLKGGHAERAAIRQELQEAGYVCADYTDNEVARLHVRHLVGGPAGGLGRERFFRFEFPERPGALLQFLETLGAQWNITLFHYRNHGAAFGRVLAGFAVAAGDDATFEADLQRLDFWHCEESGNPALRQFVAR